MQVIEIKPDWLVEIAPHYYKLKDVEDGNSSFQFFSTSSNPVAMVFVGMFFFGPDQSNFLLYFCCIFAVLSGCTLSLGYCFCMVSVIINTDSMIGVSLASRHSSRVDFI
jgi:hypothetical protein